MGDTFSIEVVFRLLVASLLGGIIGFEREIHGRPAGLRTHILVCMGAAVFMMLSPFVASFDKANLGDPGRIAAGIVSGIGFLGAGAILKEGLTVRGLTTAACLWIVAAIGMATGAGCYIAAILTTFIALCSLVLLPYLEALIRKNSYRRLSVRTSNDVDMAKIIAAVKRKDLKILYCDFDRDYETGTATTTLSVRLYHKDATDKLAHTIVKALEESDIQLRGIDWSH
ncbi:MAG: MgtC/SapB family protein [Planctomycetes bacterium]|nr:MgtC/SapB family protein [Planctomycetota bacterium]